VHGGLFGPDVSRFDPNSSLTQGRPGVYHGGGEGCAGVAAAGSGGAGHQPAQRGRAPVPDHGSVPRRAGRGGAAA
jgi:hypothetical protein